MKHKARLSISRTQYSEVKVKERGEIEFEIPEVGFGNRDKVASKYADKATPEGWVASHYFGAKSSFFTKDGKQYARTTIARWIEK